MEKHGMEFLINVIWTLGFLGTSDSFGDLYRSNTDIYIEINGIIVGTMLGTIMGIYPPGTHGWEDFPGHD